MEKGLKSLQSAARTATRRGSAVQSQPSFEGRGTSDYNSDSGIGLGANSDAEMEAGDRHTLALTGASFTNTAVQHTKSASWHAPETQRQHSRHASLPMSDQVRARSLPQPLPLYQPPPPIVSARRTFDGEMTASPDDVVFPGRPASFSRYSPDSNGRGGISIQSMLSPAEPPYAGSVGVPRRAGY